MVHCKSKVEKVKKNETKQFHEQFCHCLVLAGPDRTNAIQFKIRKIATLAQKPNLMHHIQDYSGEKKSSEFRGIQ